MYKGVIFDMDGLLIDSEPLWHKGETKVFKSFGMDIDPTQTMGLKINELVEYWYHKKKWDIEKIPREKIEKEILLTMSKLFLSHGEEMPGVHAILSFFKEKGFIIAINSASHYILINSVIKKFGISEYIDYIHSGEEEEFGKPHPSGYLNTCKKMGLSPLECIAFEDSVTGVLSVKSARIDCVCIPDKNDFSNPKFAIADIKLNSLTEFNDELLNSMN